MRDTAGLGAAGNPRTVTYSYDKNGNLLMKTDASTIQYGFDDLGRPVTKTYYDGTAPVTYCYDGDNASSHSLTRGFANVPISWSCAGAPTTVANLKQRLTMVVGDHSTTTYSSYDEFGAPLSSQQTTNGVTYPAFSYSYNWLGSLLSETYPSGRKLNWAYDTTDARPTGVSASSPAVVTYASILPAGFWPSGVVKTDEPGREQRLYRSVHFGLSDASDVVEFGIEFGDGESRANMDEWESYAGGGDQFAEPAGADAELPI